MSDRTIDLKGKNVFLSGPMTGCSYNNVEEFARAHAIVRSLGAASIYNPAFAWLGQPLQDDERLTHEDYMSRCCWELARRSRLGDEPRRYYDYLVQLDGWYCSGGAALEEKIAEALGIEIVTLIELQELMIPTGGTTK